MSSKRFFVQVVDRVEGPFTGLSLKSMAKEGRIQRTTLVSVDQEKWIQAKEIEDLYFPETLDDIFRDIGLPEEHIQQTNRDVRKMTAPLRPLKRRTLLATAAGFLLLTVLVIGTVVAVAIAWNRKPVEDSIRPPVDEFANEGVVLSPEMDEEDDEFEEQEVPEEDETPQIAPVLLLPQEQIENWAIEEIIDNVLEPRSSKYQDRGFDGYEFGASQEQVDRWKEEATAQGKEIGEFIVEDGVFVAYRKSFIGDNDANFKALQKLFDCDEVMPWERFEAKGEFVFWKLPNLLVQIRFREEMTASEWDKSRPEQLKLTVFDRQHTKAILPIFLAKVQEMFEWAADLKKADDAGRFNLNSFPALFGLPKEYSETLWNTKPLEERRVRLSKPSEHLTDEALVETSVLTVDPGQKPGLLVCVESAVPDLSRKVFRQCCVLLARQTFPPRTAIAWEPRGGMSYTWRIDGAAIQCYDTDLSISVKLTLQTDKHRRDVSKYP